MHKLPVPVITHTLTCMLKFNLKVSENPCWSQMTTKYGNDINDTHQHVLFVCHIFSSYHILMSSVKKIKYIHTAKETLLVHVVVHEDNE